MRETKQDRASSRASGDSGSTSAGRNADEPALRVAHESALIRIEELERELRGLYESPSWRVGHRLVELGHRVTGAVLKGRVSAIRLPWTHRRARPGDDPDHLLLTLLSDTWSATSNVLIQVGPGDDPALQRWNALEGRVFHLDEDDPTALAPLLQREALEHVALLRVASPRAALRMLNALPGTTLRPRAVLVRSQGRRTSTADLDGVARTLGAHGYYCLRAARHAVVTPLTGLHRWWRIGADSAGAPHGAPAQGWLVACQRHSDFLHLCGETRVGL